MSVFAGWRAALLAAAVVASLMVWGLAPQARAQPPEKTDRDPAGLPYAAGELLVTYEDDAPSARAPRSLPDEVEGTVEEELPAVEAQLLAFPEIKEEGSGEEREALLERKKRELEADPAVEAVDYNYYRRALFVPNDPLFGRQYGLAKIKAPTAWNTARGTRDTRIAIVDTGVESGHPDLAGKVVAQRNLTGTGSSPSARDRYGHGTAVAGVAAAAINNGRGIAGTCPECSLMAAKVGRSLEITIVDEVQGINWSVDNGAEVINVSISGLGRSNVEEKAINRAWESGILVVAAAGNSDSDEVEYPAGYENAISVSATDRNDRRAYFSNYGRTVDVAAPGIGIFTTDIAGEAGYWPSAYGPSSGTSFSSPFVAGLAGLLHSQGRTRDEIRERIEGTADDLGAPGKDRYFGFGRVNAARAVGSDTLPPPSEDDPPTISPSSPKPDSRTYDRTPTISAVVRDDETDLRRSNLSMTLDGRNVPFDYEETSGEISYTPKDNLSRGRHSAKVTARDESGRETAESWTFEVTKRRSGETAFSWNLDDADDLLFGSWPI